MVQCTKSIIVYKREKPPQTTISKKKKKKRAFTDLTAYISAQRLTWVCCRTINDNKQPKQPEKPLMLYWLRKGA